METTTHQEARRRPDRIGQDPNHTTTAYTHKGQLSKKGCVWMGTGKQRTTTGDVWLKRVGSWGLGDCGATSTGFGFGMMLVHVSRVEFLGLHKIDVAAPWGAASLE